MTDPTQAADKERARILKILEGMLSDRAAIENLAANCRTADPSLLGIVIYELLSRINTAIEKTKEKTKEKPMSDYTEQSELTKVGNEVCRIADSLDRHNKILTAILAEMRAARWLSVYTEAGGIVGFSPGECEGAQQTADRLTAEVLGEEKTDA